MRVEKFVVRYIERKKCPACAAATEKATPLGRIQIENYLFNKHYVPAHPPGGGTGVVLCPECGLCYKDHVPEPADLSRLFESTIGGLWNDRYDYGSEIEVAERLFPGARPEVLDVGASTGEMLRSFTPFCSRLSALDVVKNPECEKYVKGEYITSWLEDKQLSWSGNPYDLVTLFDVVEHLYDAEKAFDNLRKLVRPGGYVLIETGDAESTLPRRYGVNNWWYLNRVEHHVAFTRDSLGKVAARFGFKVALFRKKRNKYVSTFSLLRVASVLAMSAAYSAWPAGYLKAMDAVFQRPVIQPRPLIEADHMLIALERDYQARANKY